MTEGDEGRSRLGGAIAQGGARAGRLAPRWEERLGACQLAELVVPDLTSPRLLREVDAFGPE